MTISIWFLAPFFLASVIATKIAIKSKNQEETLLVILDEIIEENHRLQIKIKEKERP